MKTVKISDSFCLNAQEVKKEQVVVQINATNHIFVVDVSGSMSSDLPMIRKQLKNKLSTIMRDNDTISIIWFSDDDQSGILKEEVEVKSLKTLSDLNDAIDKWLKPVGCTAFRKPLVLAKELIGRIRKNRPNTSFSLIFLTDGWNNDCQWPDVIKAVTALTDDISASTFVEYGYYADSKRIQEMASILGGERINTSDFDEFEPVFDKKISTGGGSTKKILVDISTRSLLYDFAYSCDKDGAVILYNIVDGKVAVNESIDDVYYFSSDDPKPSSAAIDNTMLYSAIYVLADKLKYDDAEKLFMLLGDVHYYTELMNAYGKQKLNSFKNGIKACITDESLRFPKGKTYIHPVPDNAYCLMNLIDDLSKSNLKFYPSHESFNYKRIGRKKVAVGDKLNESDQQRLANAKTVVEMTVIAKELEENKIITEFINTDYNCGYYMSDLVWSEERANLSIRIMINGSVKLPTNKFGINEVASYKYNTFTLIKDGILNVTVLPVDYSNDLNLLLLKNSIKFNIEYSNSREPMYIMIDLTSLPIINRGMSKSISAKDLAILEWELLKLQADAKVYGDYRKTLYPKTSKSFVDMLGQECADWLKEIGITDFNGYSPKSDLSESKDFYMAVNLVTKIKGYSSLPKVSDVVSKLAVDKTIVLKPTEWIMSKSINEIIPKLNSIDLEDFIINRTNDIIAKKRAIMQSKAQIVFGLILSKKWFTEFKSFDENKLDLILDNINLNFTFDLCEKQVSI